MVAEGCTIVIFYYGINVVLISLALTIHLYTIRLNCFGCLSPAGPSPKRWHGVTSLTTCRERQKVGSRQMRGPGRADRRFQGCGTKLLERGWTLFFSDVAQGVRRQTHKSPAEHHCVRVLRGEWDSRLHAKTWVWEELGEAMEKEFRLASRKFW